MHIKQQGMHAELNIIE